MSRVKQGAAIYRPDLGQLVMEFVEGPAVAFIGLEVMPIFPVGKQAGTYPVIPKEALLKLADTSRAPRGGYQRGDWEYERGQYATSEQGWEEPLDDVEEELFSQEAPGAAEMVATQRAWNKIMRNQEKRIADLQFGVATLTTNANVSSEWNSYSTADPVGDVKDGIASFRSKCGMMPDALVINYTTYLDIPRCTAVQSLLKYTYPGIDVANMNTQILAALFGVPRVLVAGSLYDSGGKGQDATITDLWSYEYASLVKIASGMDITEPCVGRTFLWTEDSPTNPIVEQYRDESIRSEVYRVRHHVSEEIIASKNSSGTVVSNISDSCKYLMANIHS